MTHDIAYVVYIDPQLSDFIRDTLVCVTGGVILMGISFAGKLLLRHRSSVERHEKNFKLLQEPARETLGVEIELEKD